MITSTHSFAVVPAPTEPATTVGSGQVFNKITEVTARYFHFGQSLITFAFGLQAVISEGISASQHTASGSSSGASLCARIKEFCIRFFENLKAAFHAIKFQVVQGLLYIGSGICGSLAALQEAGLLALGRAYFWLSNLDVGLFLTACIHGIINAVEAFRNASQLSPEAARKVKICSILAIISCVGYIVSIACSLLPPLASLSFILGCLGGFVNFIKTLYDFFY